jgi:hypothetical protein
MDIFRRTNFAKAQLKTDIRSPLVTAHKRQLPFNRGLFVVYERLMSRTPS